MDPNLKFLPSRFADSSVYSVLHFPSQVASAPPPPSYLKKGDSEDLLLLTIAKSEKYKAYHNYN